MPPRNTIRCPWCTARVAEGARCAACGCEPVDASDYGVARMLRAAGVDSVLDPALDDGEPFLAGPGPRTVVEYAQLLKALQAGNDALGVLGAFGLDAPSWAACATRWSALMTRRPDVALRFAALLAEQWR